MKNRTFALCLIVLTMVFNTVSCHNDTAEPSVISTDSQNILNESISEYNDNISDDLPEKDLNGTEMHILTAAEQWQEFRKDLLPYLLVVC